MNISFFLKPKVEVSYLTESCPVQKAIDDMLHSGQIRRNDHRR